MKKTIVIFIVSILFSTSYSQEQKTDYSQYSRDEIQNMSYEELLALPLEDLMKLAEKLGVSVDDLLNMKITVSSKAALTPRESPGIVSIVTADDIKNSGARDLIDILNLVPGFSFGYDLDGVIGLASRGNWGHEGKILMLMDGLELNENFFSTYQFGNRIAVDQIKRIEIIRGPGSCLYGGYAELGVINIITKDATDLKGVQLGYAAGAMKGGAMRNEYSYQEGNSFGKFNYTLGGFYSNGMRSSTNYNTFDTLSYNMVGKEGALKGRNINLSMNYGGLKTRFIYDYFSTKSFEYNTNPSNSFTNYLGEVKYDIKLNEKITITPRLSVKSQTPWEMHDANYEYKRTNIRYTGNINTQYDVSKHLVLNTGAELLTDNAKDGLSDTTMVFGNGKKKIEYTNLAAYVQLYFKSEIANISVGGRFDHNSYVGNNVAPRIAFTRIVHNVHFKLLYSKAFRAPAIENLAYNPSIKAEKTTVAEFEAGLQVSKHFFVTGNLFAISINNPIVYTYDSLQNENYLNYASTGTTGYELECRFVEQKCNVTANYSYYQAQANHVTEYEVPGQPLYLQAFPRHKVAINGVYKLSDNVSIAPSVVVLGNSYGYSIDNKNVPVLKNFKTQTHMNLFVNYDNFILQHLYLGFGIYDLLNNGTRFIQAYGSSFPALPGYSREINIRLLYKFAMKQH